jgi:hypothetical protein
MLSLILTVFALVLFLLAAFVDAPNPPNRLIGRLACFGLACLAGAAIPFVARATGLIH